MKNKFFWFDGRDLKSYDDVLDLVKDTNTKSLKNEVKVEISATIVCPSCKEKVDIFWNKDVWPYNNIEIGWPGPVCAICPNCDADINNIYLDWNTDEI